MDTIEKSTVYVSNEGVLYIKLEGYPCIHGVFKLQMVAPQEIQIDDDWFRQKIEDKSIKKLGVIKEKNRLQLSLWEKIGVWLDALRKFISTAR